MTNSIELEEGEELLLETTAKTNKQTIAKRSWRDAEKAAWRDAEKSGRAREEEASCKMKRSRDTAAVNDRTAVAGN